MARSSFTWRCCFAAHAVSLWALVFGILAYYLQLQPPQPGPPGVGQWPIGKDALVPCSLSIEPRVYFAGRVVLSSASPSRTAAALLHVGADGTFVEVRPSSYADAVAYAELHRVPLVKFPADATVSPGLIDVHVHISALGDRGWEGYESATRAAVAGGITTVIGMPLNSLPPTVTLGALRAEARAAAAEPLFADVGYWGGVIPESLANGSIAELLADTRTLGIKAFLSPLPAAAGYVAVSPEELSAVASSAAEANVPLLVHCELMTVEEMDELVAQARAEGTPRRFETFLRTRPRAFEQRAIDAVSNIALSTPGLHAHVVHLSDADSLPRLQEVRRRLGSGLEGKPGGLSVETCPHYLVFAAEEVPDGETRMKCLPPIRAKENQERLWRALANNSIDLIASDHSPCLPEMRAPETGDFLSAWAGISALQFGLLATWTEARKRGFAAAHLARWWSERPARLAGLWQQKGSLERHKHADFVVWSEGALAPTDHAFHRHPGSPFVGKQLYGKVLHTFTRGREAFRHDNATGPTHGPAESAACGRVLRRAGAPTEIL